MAARSAGSAVIERKPEFSDAQHVTVRWVGQRHAGSHSAPAAINGPR